MRSEDVVHGILEKEWRKVMGNDIKMWLFAKYASSLCLLSEKISNFVLRTIEIHYDQRHQLHHCDACRKIWINKWLAEKLGYVSTMVS